MEPAKLDDIFPVIASVIRWALILAGSVSVIVIILGGIKYIYSGGDPKQVDTAKKQISFAVVGLILILLSFFIINLVADVTGANCITKLGFGVCRACGDDNPHGSCDNPSKTCQFEPGGGGRYVCK